MAKKEDEKNLQINQVESQLTGEETDRMGMTFILYKTTDSNDGNWGVEVMYNYFFDQLDEGLEYILP